MPWNQTTIGRILLVEDDPVHARIMRRAFEGQSQTEQIVHLSDGESALQSLHDPSLTSGNTAGHLQTLDGTLTENASAQPDGELPRLILLDLRLPTVDGFEVLQAIRSNPRTHHIPVIIVSTSERQTDIRHAYDLGANAYITKPVDYNSFIEKLKALRDFWLVSAELPCDDES